MFGWWKWWPRKRHKFSMREVQTHRTATFILYKHKYKVGDTFVTKDIHGKVEHVNGSLIRVRIWEQAE